jgi:hypothetical protein
MSIMKKLFVLICSAGLAFTAANAQEIKMPAPSPTATIHQDFSTSYIDISYSRPAMRGRKIFGGLVPYGEVWRTGANSATNITFGEDVIVNGHPIKAGAYALYTIPGEIEWKIIFNTDTKNWGDVGYTEKDNVTDFMIPVQHIDEAVQSFTINTEDMTDSACNIVLRWANTKIAIPVLTHNDARIMAYLEKALKSDKPPYQKAAAYYLKTNRNLDEALGYVTKAIDANPKAFYLHWLKARIYQKTGKKEEALAEAAIAAKAAKGTAFETEYQNDYDNLKKEME